MLLYIFFNGDSEYQLYNVNSTNKNKSLNKNGQKENSFNYYEDSKQIEKSSNYHINSEQIERSLLERNSKILNISLYNNSEKQKEINNNESNNENNHENNHENNNENNHENNHESNNESNITMDKNINNEIV